MDRESIKAEMDGRANEILMARIEYEQDRSEENGLEWIRRSMELGDLLFGQGMYRDAECAYSRACEAGMEVCGYFPTAEVLRRLAGSFRAMGEACRLQGKMDAVKICYERTLDYCRRLLQSEAQPTLGDYRNYYVVLMGLGGFAREEGACNQAKEYYENGAGICRDLVAEFHDTGDRMNLALFYALLGGLSRMMGKTKKAKLYYEQCVDLWERILQGFRQELQSDVLLQYAEALECLACMYQDDDEWAAAESCHERCLPILRQRLAETGSRDDAVRLSAALEHLGIAMQMTGKAEASLEYLEQCLSLRSRLYQIQKTALSYDNLGLAYYNLAMGSTGENRELYARKAYAVWEELCRLYPDSETYQMRRATVIHDLLS